MPVTSEAVACYRLYAANCIELAEFIPDVDRRLFLLSMARDWLRLAEQAEQNGSASQSDALRHAVSHREPAADR